MNNELRALLKAVRQRAGHSSAQAASYVYLDARAWRSWEAFDDKPSSRIPPKSAIWSYFWRAGIQMPAEFRAYLDDSPLGRCFSIASYKGGVGKSPLTVNIAAQLVARGFTVAVVTNDEVFRGMRDDHEEPPEGSLVSRIDFYDEDDIVTSISEIRALESLVRRQVTQAPQEEQEVRAILYRREVDTLARKGQAKEILGDLIKRYDYVLLDLNRSVKLIRKYADFVAVILDNECRMSVESGKKFVTRLRSLKRAKAAPICFGLITHFDASWFGEVLEPDDEGLSDELVREKWTQKRGRNRARENMLERIRSVDFPLLDTRLSSAYRVVLDLYNEERDIFGEYGYFHSILDIAPQSYAAYEIQKLTEELIDCRTT
jgi:chromosome partitioning protein